MGHDFRKQNGLFFADKVQIRGEKIFVQGGVGIFRLFCIHSLSCLPLRLDNCAFLTQVAIYCSHIIIAGPNRGSAIRGRSVHNQRIERLWGDTWRQFVHVFYEAFSFLEHDGLLSIDNPTHLWCLHYVYLPLINKECLTFIKEWNVHGIRTEKGSPAPKTMFMQVHSL